MRARALALIAAARRVGQAYEDASGRCCRAPALPGELAEPRVRAVPDAGSGNSAGARSADAPRRAADGVPVAVLCRPGPSGAGPPQGAGRLRRIPPSCAGPAVPRWRSSWSSTTRRARRRPCDGRPDQRQPVRAALPPRGPARPGGRIDVRVRFPGGGYGACSVCSTPPACPRASSGRRSRWSATLAVVTKLLERGDEVVGHGYRWSNHFEMTREEERVAIRRAGSSIEATTGTRPVGWYCREMSVNTRELVVEAGSFLYDSDCYNDDLPYWTRVGDTDHLGVPYSLVVNDIRYIVSQGFSSLADFFETARATLDRLLHDGDDVARMMSVGLQPRLSRNPARSEGLARFIEYAQGFSRGGVHAQGRHRAGLRRAVPVADRPRRVADACPRTRARQPERARSPSEWSGLGEHAGGCAWTRPTTTNSSAGPCKCASLDLTRHIRERLDPWLGRQRLPLTSWNSCSKELSRRRPTSRSRSRSPAARTARGQHSQGMPVGADHVAQEEIERGCLLAKGTRTCVLSAGPEGAGHRRSSRAVRVSAPAKPRRGQIGRHPPGAVRRPRPGAAGAPAVRGRSPPDRSKGGR